MPSEPPAEPILAIEAEADEWAQSLIYDTQATLFDRIWDRLRKEGRTLATVDDVNEAWAITLDEMQWCIEQMEGGAE